MAILRKSALALAAIFCLGVAVPVFAQAGADKTPSDIKAAQTTLKDIKALGAEIKARQSGAPAETGSTPVAAPVVRRTAATTPGDRATGKKPTTKKPAAKKKKNP